MKNNNKGFTLLEILLVVAAIAILAGIVIVAINPSKQLGDTRDAQRWSDVNTILNATYQYSIDHNGTLPSGITSTATAVCNTTDTTGTDCADESFIDLGVLFDDEKYLTNIPSDPQCATDFSTCYTIKSTTGNRITVTAPDAEGDGVTITVTK